MIVSEIGVQTKGLQVLDRRVYPVGEKIFREGESGNRAYIVQRGNVGPGGIFGEMELIDDEPRMASAVVSDSCVSIVITSALFQKKLNSLDPFLGGVLRILVENIRSIQEAKQDTQALEAMFDCIDGEFDGPPDKAKIKKEKVAGAYEIA